MKVLIISHNPVSSQSNMGKTFLSLFSQFGREELCQLYIYPTIPSEDRCGSYYRMTDKEALRACFFRGPMGGEIPRERISQEQGAFERPGDAGIYRSRKNKTALRRLLRDAMWRLSGWHSDGLNQWLDRQQPDRIFVAPGAAKFLYDFALEISRQRQIPIVTYLCDEYYFVNTPKTALDRLRLRLLKGKMEALLARTDHLVVISEELKAAYAAFGRRTTVLMTGGAFPRAEKPAAAARPQEIRYFGNVRWNRYVSLGEIGVALEEINREMGTAFRLAVYSPEQDAGILGSLAQSGPVELRGFVTGDTFRRALADAPLLLHVEAFDPDSVDYAKHSVSTKIADSLNSGIALLAYGPEALSSMGHLIRHDCAITATSREQLRQMLMTGLFDEARCRQVAENGLAVAEAYHDSAKNSRQLREILESL